MKLLDNHQTPSPAPEPEIQTREVRSDAAPVKVPAKPKSNHGFRNGIFLYTAVFLTLCAVGLVLLWQRMDVYEKSRPQAAMERFMAANAGHWRETLIHLGMEESYAETLPLENPEYYKLLGQYTDAAPIFGVRLDGKTMLSVPLKQGAELPFGVHEWTVAGAELLPSGLRVYAPAGATLTLDGAVLGPEHVSQENAQPLTLGPLEEGHREVPGLTRYGLDEVFTVENLTVTDGTGAVLPLSFSEGNSYYYAPLTRSCTITAPSGAAVTVNGVPLTAENAEISTEELPDLKEAASYIDGELPQVTTYRVEGLVLSPEVNATDFVGRVLVPAEAEDFRFVFHPADDPAFTEEQSPRILEVFDAYIAYGTNRGGNRGGNYSRYQGYLVPGSDAAVRAQGALESVYYAQGRSAALDSVQVTEVVRYAEDLFTARVDFTLVTDDVANANSYLFVFVPCQGTWRVCSALNK